MKQHKTLNTIYNVEQDRSLIGRENKRGQQHTAPSQTRNSLISQQKYISKDTSTLPRQYDNTLIPGWKRHGNTVHSIHTFHNLVEAGVKQGIGVVIPQRAVDTRTKYFENREGV